VPKLPVFEIETRHGVTAAELLDRRADSQRWITATALELWLVENGFAEPNGEPGRLVPTQLAIEVGGLLFPSDRVVRVGRDLYGLTMARVPKSEQLAARARAWVERTCREQGISVKISDPRTIERVAAIFREGRAKRPRA
jgi:hypothetical protein